MKSQFPAEAQDATNVQVQFTYDKTYTQMQQSNLFTIVLQCKQAWSLCLLRLVTLQY
jgi:hypothetical protein